VIPKTNVEAI